MIEKAIKHPILEELIGNIEPDGSNLVVIAGTGVSIHSCGIGAATASWKGLLSDGLRYCKQYDLLGDSDPIIIENLIGTNETKHLIHAATMIKSWLRKEPVRYENWLKEAIGALKPSDGSLVAAIQTLGGLLCTLNYDDIISSITKRPIVSWNEPSRIDRLLVSRQFDSILHIHGHWRSADSVILDQPSYEMIRGDRVATQMIQRFLRWHQIVFVGCSGTFSDPNFERFAEWCSSLIPECFKRHYILCLEDERKQILKHTRSGFLEPVIYGTEHGDLCPFIANLTTKIAEKRRAQTPLAILAAIPGVQLINEMRTELGI